MSGALKITDDIDPDGDLSPLVLVVDDSRAQRRLMGSYLSRWGYRVLDAESGAQALEICQASPPDLILSDWMMPGMDGLEFCSRYRALEHESYGYFILLTSKSEKNEIAQGLDVGADDFLTKPVNSAELRARIRAGERVLEMERQLKEKNRLVSATLSEMQMLYDAIDRDLVEARKLQQSLVPDRVREFDNARVSMLLQPAGRVGGDLVGAFAISDTEIGVYSIDVSGHGIASALMTARLAAYFSGNSAAENIAIEENEKGERRMRPPGEVAEHLNTLILEGMETEHYLTMLLAQVNLQTGDITMTQAGHPHPALQRAEGGISFLGDGGMPIGLIPGATFSDFHAVMRPGDRLFLGSDGLTECEDPEGNMLEEPGLTRLLTANARLSGQPFFDAIIWDLTSFSGDQDFADDVSGVLIEFLAE